MPGPTATMQRLIRRMVLSLAVLQPACTYWVSERTCAGPVDCLLSEVCGDNGFCITVDTDDAAIPSLCGSTGCAPPRAVVDSFERTDSTIRMQWTLVAAGQLPVLEATLCPIRNQARSTGPAVECQRLDPRQLWESPVGFADLQPGLEYRFRLTLQTAESSHDFETDAVSTLPASPMWVQASDGLDPNEVSVDWQIVPDATGYIVWRDGVATAQVDSPPWTDTNAGTGGPPHAPVVMASDDVDWFWVDVQWTEPSVEPGPTHTYAVQTIGIEDRSALSTTDTGFVSGPPVDYYELCIDDCDSWQRVTGRQYIDRDSPLRTLVDHPLRATRGTVFEDVLLETAPSEGDEPDLTNYTVRAVNAAGTGDAASDTGYRNIGPGGITIKFMVHFAWDGRKLDRPDVAPPIVSEEFVHRWRPPEPARTYSMEMVYRSVGAGIQTASVTFGYAAECDVNHPCQDPLTCSRGVCSWPDMVPFFRSQVYRGLRPDLFEYQPGDERGMSEVTYDYDIHAREVTQQNWVDVWGTNPAFFSLCGADCPVENITWYSALAYANRLSELNGLTPCYVFPEDCSGQAATGALNCSGIVEMVVPRDEFFTCDGFRLPTEFEWEIAGGGYREFPNNLGVGAPLRYDCEEPDAAFDTWAVYCANAALGPEDCASYGLSADCRGTWPVGKRSDNGWGVYDAIGNVAEWTWGERGAWESGGRSSPDLNPVFWPEGDERMVRGGSFNTDPRLLGYGVRSTQLASYRGADIGFRLVRSRP